MRYLGQTFFISYLVTFISDFSTFFLCKEPFIQLTFSSILLLEFAAFRCQTCKYKISSNCYNIHQSRARMLEYTFCTIVLESHIMHTISWNILSFKFVISYRSITLNSIERTFNLIFNDFIWSVVVLPFEIIQWNTNKVSKTRILR